MHGIIEEPKLKEVAAPPIFAETNVKSFDAVFVGASPIVLCKALEYARAGRTVCVVDKSEALGGAWATMDLFGVGSIEFSPHIFMPDKKANDTLKRMFPGTFSEVENDAKEVFLTKRFGKITLPLKDCLSVSAVRNYKYRIEEKRGLLLVRVVKSLAGTAYGTLKRWRHNRCKTIYPTNGLNDWIEKIGNEIKKHNGEILLGHAVTAINAAQKEISIGSNNITVELSGGNILRCDEVGITNALNLGEINVGNECLKLDLDRKKTFHLTIIGEGRSRNEFWSVYGDERFEMLNDITQYCQKMPNKSPQIVITARLNSRNGFDENELEEYVKRMKELGYVDRNFKIVDSHVCELNNTVLTSPAKSRLRNVLGGALNLYEAGEKGFEKSIRNYFPS